MERLVSRQRVYVASARLPAAQLSRSFREICVTIRADGNATYYPLQLQLGMGSRARTARPDRPENPGPVACWAGFGSEFGAQRSGRARFGLEENMILA
jgi:hypothetical protein